VAWEDKVSPNGVGFDIACGNKAVLTTLRADEIRGDLPRLMDEISGRISFGMGRANNEPADHEVLDRIREAPFELQRTLAATAARQLGTVGGGNHYVDLLEDEEGRVWVGVHFGSRGFGHKTATGFLALAQGKAFGEHAAEGGMDTGPVLFDTNTDLGQGYIEAMQLAGDYAYAGRDLVVAKVLEILGAESTLEIHNHHNFAWREHHGGRDVWVVRKGATPAFPGQLGFVGGSMGTFCVILEGIDSPVSVNALRSTVHGAGRVMSRTEAAGKSRKRWSCSSRDCDWVQPPKTHKPPACPTCGGTRFSKRWVQERAGRVDWPAVRAELAGRGIELRGGGADEAPEVYKDLHEVLAAQGDTISVRHQLIPLGVVMAGPEVKPDD
jgi:tRNA-splicing ligase RtcB